MKVGDVLELSVDALGFEGLSIARVEGIVIFVEDGLPGDFVRVILRKKKKKYFHASIQEILIPSASRIPARCEHVDDCGGCSWQHCSYQTQLHWKQQHTVDCFERLGKIPFGELRPIIASPQTFHYRNKMEFSFSSRRWLTDTEIASEGEVLQRDFALGLHVPGRYDAIIDVKTCHLQHEECNAILQQIRRKALELGVGAYNDKAQSGFLRHLVLRRTIWKNQIMLILISSSPREQNELLFVQWLATEFAATMSDDTTIIHAVKDSLSPVAQGEPTLLYGSGFISERCFDVEFRISAFSFFQTNSFQLPNFLQTIFDAAELTKNSVVWDLYCGTGSISLPAATKCGSVIGIELSAHSIQDARHNASLNNIENVRFESADLHRRETIEYLKSLPRPDVVILDPPRAGVHDMLLQHLLSLDLKKIIYVSCNPATQARDCAILSSKYQVTSMQALDMFPHTFHVENIAVLEAHVAS